MHIHSFFLFLFFFKKDLFFCRQRNTFLIESNDMNECRDLWGAISLLFINILDFFKRGSLRNSTWLKILIISNFEAYCSDSYRCYRWIYTKQRWRTSCSFLLIKINYLVTSDINIFFCTSIEVSSTKKPALYVFFDNKSSYFLLH